MKIEYAVPSYGRPDGVTTLNYLPKKAKMYVSPQDYPKYVQANPEFKDSIIQVPDGVQGKGKAHAMNWLLDNLWQKDTDAVLFLDDDISTLREHGRKGRGTGRDVSEDEFYQLAEQFSRLAKEWGCGMWSFNLYADPMSYVDAIPFRLHAYLDGTLQGFVRNDRLRYDEELKVKEDVDMFLQQIYTYHKALRVDRYYFKVKSFSGSGGSQAFRSEETEKEQFKLMQKKWGSDVIRQQKPRGKSSNIRGMGAAIRINLPLDGV